LKTLITKSPSGLLSAAKSLCAKPAVPAVSQRPTRKV
jgi:hypothetical protein